MFMQLLCVWVSGSCKPSASCIFSMSILLRSVGKIHTHHCPKVRIICKPTGQSCTEQETQPIAHNLHNMKDAHQQHSFLLQALLFILVHLVSAAETRIYDFLKCFKLGVVVEKQSSQNRDTDCPLDLLPWGEKCTIHFNASASSGKAALCK